MPATSSAKLLAECEGTIDLSGETTPVPGAGPTSDKTDAILDQWEKQHPALAK